MRPAPQMYSYICFVAVLIGMEKQHNKMQITMISLGPQPRTELEADPEVGESIPLTLLRFWSTSFQ